MKPDLFFNRYDIKTLNCAAYLNFSKQNFDF